MNAHTEIKNSEQLFRNVTAYGGKRKVYDNLLNVIDNAPESLREPAKVHFSRSGKGLRGLLAYSTCKSIRIDDATSIQWATVVELIHNASLVHDDVCDRDSFRRGQESIYKKYGEAVAICLGDYFLSQAYAEAAKISASLVIEIANAVTRLSSGQASEFITAGYPTWKNYCVIASNKTAPALALAVEGSLHMGGLNYDEYALHQYFDSVAICFQILNDLKNFAGVDGAENPCSDLANCRPNAVIACFKTSLDAVEAAKFDIWADKIRSGDLIADTVETRYWWQKIKASTAFKDVHIHLESLFNCASNSIELIHPTATNSLNTFHLWLCKEMNAMSEPTWI